MASTPSPEAAQGHGLASSALGAPHLSSAALRGRATVAIPAAMAPTGLVRLAGPVGIAAGALLIATHTLLWLVLQGRADNDPLVILNGVLSLLALYLVLVALIGLYARQAGAAGTFGLIAFLAALLGTTLLTGDKWFEAFAGPYLTEVAPQVFTEHPQPGGTLIMGGIGSFAAWFMGWLLFGIATLRARIFPRSAAILLILGAFAGLPSPLNPGKLVLLALAIAWMGSWVQQSDHRSEVRS